MSPISQLHHNDLETPYVDTSHNLAYSFKRMIGNAENSSI